MHKEVPELVYLQTRKLLRDIHYRRASMRQTEVNTPAEDGKTDDNEVYNPNL